MIKNPLKALVAVTAILGASVVASVSATIDDQLAQAPAAQTAPVTDESAAPAPDQPARAGTKPEAATEKSAAASAQPTAEKPIGAAAAPRRGAGRNGRIAARPAASVRTSRPVRVSYYRVAGGAEVERGAHSCFLWCGRVLFLGIGF